MVVLRYLHMRFSMMMETMDHLHLFKLYLLTLLSHKVLIEENYTESGTEHRTLMDGVHTVP